MNNSVRIIKTLVSWVLLQICAACIMAAAGFNFTFPVPNQEATLDGYYVTYSLLQLFLSAACIFIYNNSRPRWD